MSALVAPTERREWRFPHSDHLSPSQISEFLGCPLCFRLSRIDRVPHPLSVALPIGGAVHKAVEILRIARLKNPNGVDSIFSDLPEAAAEHFDESIESGADNCDACWDKSDVEKAKCEHCNGTGKLAVTTLDLAGYGSVGEAKDHAVAITRYVLPELARLDAARGLVAAELDLRDFDNPFPFPMHGRVDALYSSDGEHYTAGSDLKTSSKQQAPAFAAALQIGIYREFIPGAWFIDQVAKTQRPSFVTYSLDQGGAEFVYELVLDVANRICQGDFPARPGFLCKYAHPGPAFSVTVDGLAS